MKHHSVWLLVVILAAPVFADFDGTLSQVASYDYGDSRQPLSDLTDMLRRASGDEMQLLEYEKAMIEVLLEKQTPFAARQYLCKELSIMGSELSVDPLYKLLTSKDEKLADIARYALERIPGEQVDTALVKAMGKTKDVIKVGVINTIGERRIAVEQDLGKLLMNKNDDIAMAAAAALGKIGSQTSATLLGEALLKLEPPVRKASVDAYLKNADVLLKAGEKDKARLMYQSLYTPEESMPIRSAALTGLIKTTETPTEIIVAILQEEENPDIRAVAISMVHQCRRDLDLKTIAAELPELDPLGQVQLLTAFKEKGDPVSREAVNEILQSTENMEVKMAAIDALSVVGGPEDVMILANMSAKARDEEKEALDRTLGRMNAEGVDDRILELLPDAEPQVKEVLVNAISDRQMEAVDVLIETASDDNPRVRVAALKALGQLGKPDKMDTFIDLLVKARNNAERREAERMLVAVANRIPEEEQRGDAVIEALSEAEDLQARSSLMLVAGRIGDNDALPIMRQALESEDAELKRAAILSLSEWPTPEPLEDLLTVAQSADQSSHRVLALRGYLQLLTLESERNKPETVKLYKTALDLATEIGEKRMALSGLGKVHCLGALLLADDYLDDPELKGEAEIAVMENAFFTRDSDSAERKAAIEKVLEQTTDDRIKEGAEELLNP